MNKENRLFRLKREARLKNPEMFSGKFRTAIFASEFEDLPWLHEENDTMKLGHRFKDLGNGFKLYEERSPLFNISRAELDENYRRKMENSYEPVPYAIGYDIYCAQDTATVERYTERVEVEADPVMAALLARLDAQDKKLDEQAKQLKRLKKS